MSDGALSAARWRGDRNRIGLSPRQLLKVGIPANRFSKPDLDEAERRRALHELEKLDAAELARVLLP
jgi:hypothetical protein